ncbi:MAG TPA: DUF2851 domain-containing protein [Bacteroidales bacterium]|nr:DUF2851 domain-containing protein [Bacteroidales bacterium]
MDESLLHFMWRYQSFTFNGLCTTNGEPIEVIDPGLYNTNSGPDFSNAKVRIGKTLWAGNVEMHIKSSEWYLHNHHSDSAYDNVILHVVVENDQAAVTTRGTFVQTLVVPYPTDLRESHENLMKSAEWIPCASKIRHVNPLLIDSTIDRMQAERLETKSQRVIELVNLCNGSWEEAFYRDISRSFGLKNNALPFQLLAQALPLKILAKHRNNILQIEALLFGQSGLLEKAKPDSFTLALKKEYGFLKEKYHLTPIEPSLWKFMRLRPASFPTVRIALLAMLVHKSSRLFSKLLEIETVEQIVNLLTVEASDYWTNHYIFGEESKSMRKRLGNETVKLITINTVIPFMFSYGRSRSKADMETKAITLLQQMPPEKNSIVENFEKLGIAATSAFDSQALIHLKANYCDTRKCIYCPIGVSILRKQL